jgi:hypothetical protein
VEGGEIGRFVLCLVTWGVAIWGWASCVSRRGAVRSVDGRVVSSDVVRGDLWMGVLCLVTWCVAICGWACCV